MRTCAPAGSAASIAKAKAVAAARGCSCLLHAVRRRVYRRMLECRKQLQNCLPHRGIHLSLVPEITLDPNTAPPKRAFRDEVRASSATTFRRSRRKVHEGKRCRARISCAGTASAQEGLGRRGVAEDFEAGMDAGRATHLRRRMRRGGRRVVLPFGRAHGGARDPALGNGAQKEYSCRASSPASTGGARALVAGLGLGPRVAQERAVREGDHYVVNGRRRGTRSGNTPTGSSAWCAPAPRDGRRKHLVPPST